MGAEARTTLRVGGQSYTGTALLETSEVIFRGDTRLKIPFTSITGVDVKAGALHLTHADGVAVLALGNAIAAKWAEKIRNPKSLADKLGVKAGMPVAVLGVKDEQILADVQAKGATIVRGRVPKGCAMILWRIDAPAMLERLAAHAASIARDGAIWVVHPRGNTAVADTVIFAAAKAAGLTATKVVRFSDTDTAEKLVIPKALR